MANLTHFAISLLFVSAFHLSSSIIFNFPNFPTSETINNITLEGDATSDGVDLQITSDVAKESWQLSTVRTSYAYPMDVWNAKHNTLADFTICFSFRINGTHQSGDITGQVVAVVFDTFQNEWDQADDRVCIDINSIASEKQVVWKGTFTDGKIVNALISYNSTTHNLSVFATYETSPVLCGASTVWHVIDLREVLPETVRVGFSAGTGMHFQTHAILSWELSSTLTISKSKTIVSVPPSPTVSPWRGVHIVWLVGAIIGGLCFLLGLVPSYYFELYYCLGPFLFRRRKMPIQMGREVDILENVPTQMDGEEDLLESMPMQMDEKDDIFENTTIQMVKEEDISENIPIQTVEENDIFESMSIQMVEEEDILENVPIRMGDEEDILNMSMDQEFAKGTGPKSFTFDELSEATNNFSEEGKLGQGGFGGVYKGLLVPSNKVIAVKRIAENSAQGVKEYKAEVLIISQLRHKNLVKLVGWCHEKRELLLVYEFMPNGSLEAHLFGDKVPLSWAIRYKVALGLASAMLYLHEEWEQCVLHRDIKASNVMLDSEFNAKLGDFGLARFVDHELGLQATLQGFTLGYLAPECFITGKSSKESDVYSFGVVALEIACGRRAIEPSKVNLVSWIQALHGEDKLMDAADVKLNMEFKEDQIKCLMIVGLRCCHPDPKRRPSIRQAMNGLINFKATAATKDSFTCSMRRLLFGRRKMPMQMVQEEDITGTKSFTFDGLSLATNNFSEEWKIGEEEHGSSVFKGLLVPSKKEIVVKMIPVKSEQVKKECEYEVTIISQLRHKNLVKLIGCCHEKSELLLVYEYMPNGSLDSHLFGRKDPLSWVIRYKVALGVASALLYLHEEWEQCVLHRDVKSSNVMLDSEFNAKLADFMLDSEFNARLGDVLIGIGPPSAAENDGYLAPECVTTGKYSKESDVYSFGVVALEIASGRMGNIREYEYPGKQNLRWWVWDLYEQDKLLKAADKKLYKKFEEDQIKCLMIVGLWCCHPDPASRPSIREAINVLNFQEQLPTLSSKYPRHDKVLPIY